MPRSVAAVRSVASVRSVRTPSRYAAMIIGAAPVLYWRCNEASGNLTDSSGNGNTGLVTAGVSYEQTGIPGDPGFGSIKGNGSTTAIATAATFAPTAVTLEGWWNPPSYQAANERLGGNHAASNNGFRFVAGNGTGNVEFDCAGLAMDASTVMALSQWTHIVGTWDGVTSRIYMNGVQKNSHAAAGPITAAIVEFLSGNSQHYNGQAAHFAVYPRALSPGEVREHYLVGSTAPSARSAAA